MNPVLEGLLKRYHTYRARGLALDMTRGKPCAEQLSLADAMLDMVHSDDFHSEDGIDCRNYGGFDGITEARRLFSEFLGVGERQLLIGSNSSLTFMHDTITRCLLHGNCDSDEPWRRMPRVRFLCPAPGYDRHFAVCENYGLEMVVVDQTDQGPDMDQVEALAGRDPTVKGLWVVPKYANPTGASVSSETVRRLATMRTAAPDFRIFWDNAYAHHHLTDEPVEIDDILAACCEAGHPNRVFIYGSTSKVSFAGSGLSFFGGSLENVAWMRWHGTRQSIGPDKLNQLRHVRFFGSMRGVREHMKKHAAIIRPKFELVLRILEEELGARGEWGRWTSPKGGYFISFDTMDGCARRVIELAGEAGVKLTRAGATFPYGEDPRDRNIRLAPTLPTLAELEVATRIFCTCVKVITLETRGI